MADCKNCIHKEVCDIFCQIDTKSKSLCSLFKSKDKFIEFLKHLSFCSICTTPLSKELESCIDCDRYKVKQLAIQALERQIPKQIEREGTDGSDFCYCPECRCVVGSNESIDEHFDCNDDFYCEYCGQKLSRGENDA